MLQQVRQRTLVTGELIGDWLGREGRYENFSKKITVIFYVSSNQQKATLLFNFTTLLTFKRHKKVSFDITIVDIGHSFDD